MEYLSPKLLEAFEFASIAHRHQLRKNPTETPYISHPAAVALVLAKAGFSDEVVMAGLLHDVIEDTHYTADDIRKRFGDRVAELVLGVTEDKRLPWLERNQSYNDHLRKMDKDVAAVSAADLLANRQSLLMELRKGCNPWLHFSKNPQTYAERRLKLDRERVTVIKEILKHPFVDEMERLVNEAAELTARLRW